MSRSARSSNEDVAEILDETGELLDAQGASPYRARAYRRAAATLRELRSSVGDLFEVEGLEGLSKLPNIGPRIAHHIAEVLDSGALTLLERLRGSVDPETLFMTVPGIGEKLARDIHERLGIDRLEDLESAAHDGRLAELPGFGPKRLRAVVDALAARLGRRSTRRRSPSKESAPPVAELLDVDREYREKAARGRLRTIAPRRFNPRQSSWLPVLHAERGPREYTALFSNTARAHELGKTSDWVVLYYQEDRGLEGQATVVTEYRGPLRGRRVVRSRELECQEYYRDAQ